MKTFRAMTLPSPSLHRFFGALLCALLAALLLPAARAASTVPEFMTYQGFLVDGNGNPLATNAPANYPVIFRIYDAPTGDTTLRWGESQIVTVDRGSFSVQLGEGNAVSGAPRPPLSTVFAGAIPDQRYMELTVTLASGNVTLLPRLRLLPAPYSFTATTASRLVTSNGVAVLETASGRITGDGSGLTGLTAAQIASGTFSALRIPTLDVSKITGTFPSTQIPNLDASKITSGVFTEARIPTLDASKITGTFSATQIPNVDGSKITGTLGAAQIPQNLAAHNFSGNVGVGTTVPTAKLHVVGDVRLGNTGQYYATGGDENLRIVRGRVGDLGNILAGTGFTVGIASTNVFQFAPGLFQTNYNGPYTLRFSVPFSSPPVITVSPRYSQGASSTARPYIATVDRVTQTNAQVSLFYQKVSNNTIQAEFQDGIQDFHFIAIGPR